MAVLQAWTPAIMKTVYCYGTDNYNFGDDDVNGRV